MRETWNLASPRKSMCFWSEMSLRSAPRPKKDRPRRNKQKGTFLIFSNLLHCLGVFPVVPEEAVGHASSGRSAL